MTDYTSTEIEEGQAECEFDFIKNKINVIADSIWIGESGGEPCICMDCNEGEYIAYSTEKDIERFMEVLGHYLGVLRARKEAGE